MGIWVHPFAVPLHMQVGGDLRGNGVCWPSLYDVAVSWLTLQTPIDCIPHPYWIYKVFYQLGMLWMGISWVHPNAVIRVQVGVSFRKNGVWPRLYDVVVSFLRLQTPIDCIPHPYWIYTKCLSTLRCCGWAYGYIIIAVLHVQVGGILGEMGYGRACMMLRCHG